MGRFETIVFYWRTYRQLKPNYVVHYTIKPNIYGSLAARANKVPSLAVVPGTGSVFQNSGMVSLMVGQLYKWAFRYPQKVWVLNGDDYRAFLMKI